MEHILGDDWKIIPAGGSTGAAYYAQSEQKQLFLKRNSSPFLAVLSAQGIVPKLVWTKRLENGDVVTAQQWLDGKALNPEEMQHPEVAKLLSKIHHSTELLDMLLRIDRRPIQASHLLFKTKNKIAEHTNSYTPIEIYQASKYLEQNVSEMVCEKQVVCHCDLDHHNWMLSNNGELYLIDWDNARVGDPAMDIGRILHSYIPMSEWEDWLDHYGMEKSPQLIRRMYWYLLIAAVDNYIWYQKRNRMEEAYSQRMEIKQLLAHIDSDVNI